MPVQLNFGRVVVLLLLSSVLMAIQGCGTATYEERVQQRADELRYAVDHYEN